MLAMLEAMKDTIVFYFEFEYVRNAMIVGVLTALCASLLGVTLVLKRFSFIGDGLSHVAFGTTAVATAINVTSSILFALPATILTAVLLLRSGQNAKIKGDASLAMLSVGSLAIGYLIMNLFSKSSNLSGDVCATLFGSTSILTLSRMDVWLSVDLSVLVIVIFIAFYHRIFAVTFDEDFAAATGNRAQLSNLLLAVIIASVIVVAMRFVGALLVSALVIFPALSAMRVFKTFKSVTICAAVFSVTCAVLGILISILAGTPVGSTIVAVDIAGFGLFTFIGFLHARPKATGKILFACLIFLFAAGCDGRSRPDPSVDVDLTALSSKMAFAEVTYMMNNPDKYIEKKVKISGPYAASYYMGEFYHFVLIEDKEACCTQGLAFILNSDYAYPSDYPEEETIIETTGVFTRYEGNIEDFYYIAVDGFTLVS